MSLHTYFLRQFQFEHWANEKIIKAIANAKTISDDTLALLHHIFAAHLEWYGRIMGHSGPEPLWRVTPLESCKVLHRTIQHNWSSYLASLHKTDLEKLILYQNTRGVAYQTSVADILAQLLLHSAYHRGQLIKQLKEQGLTYPNVDFIQFTRESQIVNN